ncbi:hypothetical protein [Okeania sp. SIO2B3]|uniref:hypothetical protein n=1 Tax=Okeania sp. SIO2B3 TaxID=2607784 RepID=UPI0013BEFF9D|nr:hypothetical protein [Okeania sp. SIO2B3]NET41650.1 hypothetical protein [Okeania sp. SIO2B3]
MVSVGANGIRPDQVYWVSNDCYVGRGFGVVFGAKERSLIPYFEGIIGICAGECHSPLPGMLGR